MERIKILLLVSMMLSSALVYGKTPVTRDMPILMCQTVWDSQGIHKGHTKSPVAPVIIYKNGNVLSFAENCVGGTLEVLSGDAVIYSTVIDESCMVELPEEISGVVQLRLTIGDITFCAEIEIFKHIH